MRWLIATLLLVGGAMFVPGGASAAITCNGEVATIVGTADDDVLMGGSGADVIAGLGGDDVLVGQGGMDRLCGGDGDDTLSEGANSGTSYLDGGAGSDRLYGGAGPDNCFSGEALYGCDNTTTVAPAGGSAVVLAAGDICNPSYESRAQATADVTKAHPNAPVLTLGDDQYNEGTLAQYKGCYDTTWGAFKARTKPTPGNHEYLTPGAAGYFDYFGSLAGPRGLGYYSFAISSDWVGIALNGELGSAELATEVAWMKNILAANPSKNVLAYWHRPVFSSGEHGNDSKDRSLWDAAHAGGVDIVLNGHEHDYERFGTLSADGRSVVPGGLREFIVGTGGTSQRAFSTTQPGSQVRSTGQWGVIRLTLRVADYSWDFLPAAGSTLTDSGTSPIRPG